MASTNKMVSIVTETINNKTTIVSLDDIKSSYELPQGFHYTIGIYPGICETGISFISTDPTHSVMVRVRCTSSLELDATKHYYYVYSILKGIISDREIDLAVFAAPVFDIWRAPTLFFGDTYSHFCNVFVSFLRMESRHTKCESIIASSLDFRGLSNEEYSKMYEERCSTAYHNVKSRLSFNITPGKYRDDNALLMLLFYKH